MKQIVTPLIGAAIFVLGLIKIEESVHILMNMSEMTFGALMMLVGALLISVELADW